MARLRIYTVHEKHDPAAAAGYPEAYPVLVREGFSWMAALFTFVWAIFHGLWREAVVLFVIGMAIGFLVDGLNVSAPFELAVTVGYLALVGFSAEDWRRARLARQGYVMCDVVAEKTSEIASLRYLQSIAPST